MNKPQVKRHPITQDDFCILLHNFSLQAQEYGIVRTTTSNPNGEKFSHLYRLNYIVQGRAYYSCCGRKICIEENSLVYLPPEAILEMDESAEPLEMLFINFEIMNLNERQSFNNFMLHTFPNMYVKDQNNKLRDILNHFFDEGNQGGIGYCLAMQGIFHNLFIYMIRFSNTYEKPKKTLDRQAGSISLFNQAIAYINKHIHENIKISEIAEAIGISEIYLYKIFIKHTNKSPQQLLLSYRIQLAKNYLSNPSLSIKTIASELGFSNANHFSAIFKKSTGLSPKEYRLSVQDNSDVEKMESVLKGDLINNKNCSSCTFE